MTDFRCEIDAALEGDEPIVRDDVVGWIKKATDLPTLAKLYRLTGGHYYRIQPDLGKDAECTAIHGTYWNASAKTYQGYKMMIR